MDFDNHWLITIGLVTTSVIAVTANFFLLVVFCRRRGLRTVPNRFVINLLITNLLSSILLIPLLLVDQEVHPSDSRVATENQTKIQEKVIILRNFSTVNSIEIIEETSNFFGSFPISNNTNQLLLCYFAQSTTSFVCTASIFSILLIGINQYFGVIHSLRYHFYVNKCRSTVFIGISWFIALFCAIFSSLTYSDSSLWHFCATRSQPSEAVKILNTAFAFTYFMLVILAPFVAICIIYVCIYTAAHQNSERMRRSTSTPLNPTMDYIQVPILKSSQTVDNNSLPKVHSAPNFTSLDKIGTFKLVEPEDEEFMVQRPRNKVRRTASDRSANFINTLRHKISNASVFKYREETRAAKISILVILMVLVCYIPYGITLILSSECVKVNTSQIFNYLSLVLLVFSNVLSPFLFGYRNKRVKRDICKMLNLLPNSAQKPQTDRARSQCKSNGRFLEENEDVEIPKEPFVKNCVVPKVIVTCKAENERKSILKKYTSSWTNYKKCNFITVPNSCISGEARGSFSSASTQISTEE